MDSIILAGDSLQEFSFIKHPLDSHFKIKDFSLLHYFLGLEVAYAKSRIFVFQKHYYLTLLTDTSMLGFKPAQTPSNTSSRLYQDTSNPYPNVVGYVD